MNWNISLRGAFLLALLLKIGSALLATKLINDFLVIWFPLSVMVGYLVWGYIQTKESPLQDKINYGDSCYYLGFLFTVASIILALYLIDNLGNDFTVGELSKRFAIAMSTTLLGMAVRVYFVTFGKQLEEDRTRKIYDQELEKKQLEQEKQRQKEFIRLVKEYLVTHPGTSEAEAKNVVKDNLRLEEIRRDNPSLSEAEVKRQLDDEKAELEKQVDEVMAKNPSLSRDEAQVMLETQRNRPRKAPPKNLIQKFISKKFKSSEDQTKTEDIGVKNPSKDLLLGSNFPLSSASADQNGSFSPSKYREPRIYPKDLTGNESYEFKIETNLGNLGLLNRSLALNIDETEQLRSNLTSLGTKVRLDLEHNSELLRDFSLALMDKQIAAFQESQNLFNQSVESGLSKLNKQLEDLYQESSKLAQEQVLASVKQIESAAALSLSELNKCSSQVLEDLKKTCNEGLSFISVKHQGLTDQFARSIKTLEESSEGFSSRLQNTVLPTAEWHESMSLISERLNAVVNDFENKASSIVLMTDDIQQAVNQYRQVITNESKNATDQIQDAVGSLKNDADVIKNASKHYVSVFDQDINALQQSVHSMSQSAQSLTSQVKNLALHVEELNKKTKSKGFFGRFLG